MADIFKTYGFELEDNRVPVAVILPADQEAVVGAIVKLDGRSSTDPNNSGLTYQFSFKQVPIGSQVGRFSFTVLEEDGSIVGFAPDIPGPYQVQLVVSDGSLDSDPVVAHIDVRVILVPHHQGLVPDASFIWSYLSDFWNLVDGRRAFESVWSSAIQIVASELLKLYQYDYNKSIRDIQEVIQKRWLVYAPGLVLERELTRFILADDAAGVSASTLSTEARTGLPSATQGVHTSIVAVPITEGSFERSAFGAAISAGRVLRLGGRSYTLQRANGVSKSLNSGVDGQTSSGTDDFLGSQFSSDMVGEVLRILTSQVAGDYVITAFVDEGHIQVDLDGATWPSLSLLEYTVLPSVPNFSAFFADRKQVPGGLDNQVWRFSSTLISDEFDFESQGVFPGDVIEVEITRLDLGLNSTIYGQVVSVDRNRLGFALNLADLIDGQPAPWLTDDMQVTLAIDLQVRGLAAAVDGSLVYTDESALIHTTASSYKFKRAYFERELPTDTEINLGPFSISARPVQIIRNHRVPVDSSVVSVPVLQEYIKQPTIAKNGSIIKFVVDGGIVEASREPYLLSENLDYIIDDESSIQGTCNLVAGSDEIEIPFGDLLDRSINEQDVITVESGTFQQVFEVRRLLSDELLRVSEVSLISAAGAKFSLKRRVPGKFLRFVQGVFTKTSPAPQKLWAEVTYFDNNDAVENNFGTLVGVTREDLDRASTGVPYRSAVAGLMYAMVNGPTISNLSLSAQILLGLPFTQNAGVIKEINQEFRLNDDGSPLSGRILIEAQDKNGNPTGLTNIYVFPQGRQLPDPDNPGKFVSAVPDFSGLADNPSTGKPFAVGDSVDQFVPLSKGVQVQDYLSTPERLDRLIAQGDVSSILQKYHSFQVLVNSDLISASDIDFTAQFLSRVKAHYTKFSSALLKSVEDDVEVDERLRFGRLLDFFEADGSSLTSAVKYDDRDANLTFISINGVMYARYIVGEDLETVQDSDEVASAAGGFISPRVGAIELHDEPFIRPGDLLVIHEGFNSGRYTVNEVLDDATLEVDLDGRTFFTFSPDLEIDPPLTQTFSIFRPLQNPIWAGRVAVTTGDGLVGVEVGIGSAGVAVGDSLVFVDLGTTDPTPSRIYTIVEVVPSLTTPYVVVVPEPIEASGSYDSWIVRESLMTSGIVQQFDVPSDGFRVDASAFSPYLTFSDLISPNDWLNICLLRPGDVVTVQDLPYIVLRREIGSRRILVSPTPTLGMSGEEAQLTLRPYRSSTPISVDFLDRLPGDYLELTLATADSSSEELLTSAGSPDVQSSTGTNFNGDPLTTTDELIVRPGDDVVLLEGPDSTVDVGHGLGVFPVHAILAGGTQLRLMRDLTTTGGFRYAIRRKAPDEG